MVEVVQDVQIVQVVQVVRVVRVVSRACCREVKIPNQYGGVILWCLFMYRIDP